MKDFIDSLRQQIGDRMSSPVFGSFIIAWLCWNHQYFVILFSDLPVEYRFTLAKSVLYPTPLDFWKHIVIWPTLSCLGYIILYPWISQSLLVYWDRRQTVLLNKRKEVQGKNLLSQEESMVVYSHGAEERSKLAGRVRELETELDAIKRTPADLTKKLLQDAQERITVLERELSSERARSQPSNPLGSLSDEERNGVHQLIKVLVKRPARDLVQSAIMSESGLTPHRARLAWEQATGAQLIKVRPENHNLWELSQQGLQYALRNKFID